MSSEASPSTFFFCIGAAKSGTTLLARVLDQHPDVACIWESYAFYPRSRSSIFNPASDSWKKHGFAEADIRRWSRVWQAEPWSSLRRVLRRLTGQSFFVTVPFRQTMPPALSDFGQRCKARIVGDKWPWYVEFLDAVLSVFPEARFIYNVRDPRGLWNSAQRFKNRGRGNELLERMLKSDRQVTPYLERPNFLTLRYEDLVCEPERTCRRLHEFLGCEFSDQFLHYNRESDPYPNRWDWVPEAGEQFNPWHTIKWQKQMNQRDIERVTERSRWFIEKYGYDE